MEELMMKITVGDLLDQMEDKYLTIVRSYTLTDHSERPIWIGIL